MSDLPPIPKNAASTGERPALPSASLQEKQKKKKKAGKAGQSGKNTKTKRHPSVFLLAALIALSLVCTFLIEANPVSNTSLNLTQDQLKTLIAQKAEEYGIGDHLPELQAIVKVESNGKADDVFQSSESAGLPPNTLGVHDSIDQGVRYYKSLLEKAEQLGVDQDAVFQAYNYGSGYLDYVAQNGGKHTQQLAEEFSKIYSEGRIVSYPNPIAVESNGGWRYDYGNMFYVPLIHQALGY